MREFAFFSMKVFRQYFLLFGCHCFLDEKWFDSVESTVVPSSSMKFCLSSNQIYRFRELVDY